MDQSNPLLPAWYDATWYIFVGAIVALCLIAVISLARNARTLSPMHILLWCFAILCLPVLGSIAWLALGRRRSAAPPIAGE